MLKDVVLDQVVPRGIVLDPIAGGVCALTPIKVIVPDRDPHGLEEPDVVAAGVDDPDALDPRIRDVEEDDSVLPVRVADVHGKIFDPIPTHDGGVGVPEHTRILARPPIWHAQTWSDRDLIAVEGDDLDELLLAAVVAPRGVAAFVRAGRDGADEDRATVRTVVELV